jgi:hypothetical protein
MLPKSDGWDGSGRHSFLSPIRANLLLMLRNVKKSADFDKKNTQNNN